MATEHQQSNGLVERINAVIVDWMAAFVDDPKEWEGFLAQDVYSINTSIQNFTNLSPFQVVHGQVHVIPTKVRFPWPIVEEEGSRLENMDTGRRLVVARIEQAHQTQQNFYDRRRLPAPAFCPGDLVLNRLKRVYRRSCSLGM